MNTIFNEYKSAKSSIGLTKHTDMINAPSKQTIENIMTQTTIMIYSQLNKLKESLIKPKKPTNKHSNKNKTWWSTPWQKQHVLAICSYREWLKVRNQDLPKAAALWKEYIKYKDKARSIKRTNIKLNKKKEFSKLDLDIKHKINEFYNTIKRKIRFRRYIEASIEDLEIMFRSLFNDKLNPNKEDDPLRTGLVNDFINEMDSKHQHEYKIDDKSIKSILARLPNKKAIGYTNMNYEMFKYADRTMMAKLIHELFTDIIRYSTVPRQFNISIIKPLCKDPAKPTYDTANLRPIAISDPLTNIFERLLKIEFNKVYKSDERQFGFKSNSSCHHAIYLLNECINTALGSNLPIYIIAIDASKAFDKINRTYLYYNLIKLNMPPPLIMATIRYYEKSLMMVYKDGIYSNTFEVTRGVKQGGSVSPDLWCYYSEGLTKLIRDSKIGIEIYNKTIIGSIMFADDTTAIGTNPSDCKKLVKIIDDYGIEQEITYNGDKTNLIIISNRTVHYPNDLVLNGKVIQRTEVIKFLGVMISGLNTNTCHINSRIDKLNKGVFVLKRAGISSPYVNIHTKIFMYKTYLRPILTYGMELCTMTKSELEYLKICENNIIKHILNLNFRNRHTALLIALGVMPLDEHLTIMKLRLFIRLTQANITKNVINTRLKTIETQRPGRNDLMREVYLIIKDKLLEKFTMSNMIYEAERHIEEIQMKQIAIRQHDETVNEFLNIIRNNTTTKCIQLRELTSSFDHIDLRASPEDLIL